MVLTNLSWFKVSLLTFVYWLLIVLLFGMVSFFTHDTRYAVVLMLLSIIFPIALGLRRDRSELRLWLMMTASMVLSFLAIGVWVGLREMP
jgi:hypothetical protein